MKYRFSCCIALASPDSQKALAFYNGVLGLPVKAEEDGCTELDASPFRLFLDTDTEVRGPVMEFDVDDLDAARAELEASGCTILRWQGPGGQNYVRDPFGLVFNLWQNVPGTITEPAKEG